MGEGFAGTGGVKAKTGLRQRLRERTRAAHEALDDVIGLEAHLQTRESYRELISRFWGIYMTLTSAVDRVRTSFPQAEKMTWLESDLRCLGLSNDTILVLPRAPVAPVVRDEADAFGVLYVLEGATLGGQIIARQLETALGVTKDSGGRFFWSHGAGVGTNWRRFVSALDRFGETCPEVERVERSALAAFDAFRSWMTAAEGGPVRQGPIHAD